MPHEPTLRIDVVRVENLVRSSTFLAVALRLDPDLPEGFAVLVELLLGLPRDLALMSHLAHGFFSNVSQDIPSSLSINRASVGCPSDSM